MARNGRVRMESKQRNTIMARNSLGTIVALTIKTFKATSKSQLKGHSSVKAENVYGRKHGISQIQST